MNHLSDPGARALAVYVDGIGLLGPGLPDWARGRRQLDASAPYQGERCLLPSPMALPPAERRRAGAVVKVALAVGQEAVAASGLQASTLRSVFASSSGDGVNCDAICSALASDDRLISPTRFHNSVHNAASGYWSICSGSMAASTALCAHDGSFSAGLLEAMTQVVVDDAPVLLVTYDTDYPQPLHGKRPIPDSMGVALVLCPHRGERSLARIALARSGYLTRAAAQRMDDAALEHWRQTIPAARGLPLLQAIARRQDGRLVLTYLEEAQLALDVAPC